MAKTKPIGVRFDEELLNKLKEAAIVDSPQKALNLYEKSYVELIDLKVAENNKPENKSRILEEREGLKFSNPIKKGEVTLSVGNKIEYKMPDQSSYDGEKTDRYFGDEIGQLPLPKSRIQELMEQAERELKSKK